jgi:hypothetical protein
MMDFEPASTRASSEMDTISISDDDDDETKEQKIIQEAEKKISK